MRMNLVISADDDTVGYLYLPDHPGQGNYGVSKKQIDLSSIIHEYQGPDLILDFDENNVLIGIEIMG